MPVLENPDNNAIHPGLSILHANHMEDLRRVAIEWIGAHPLQPLENETFIVQSNGMAQWLKLAMASNDGCGISAAVQMKLPARFLWDAYRAVLGEDQIPDHSPYDKDQLIWRIFRLLPTLTDTDWFSPLKRYLEGDEGLRKRYQLAFRLADLYDQYQVYRADWLKDWAAGRNCFRNAVGKPEELPSGQHWQANLWRCIHEEIPVNQRNAGRFQLHQLFLEKAESAFSRPPGLPRRVIVFGISSLPGQTLEAIHALSRLSQVLIFAHNPCRHYWAEILEDRELLRIQHARHTRKESGFKNLQPEELHQYVNPLLASWGKQGRDYIGLLYGYDQPDNYRKQFGEIDLFRDFVPHSNSAPLLSQIQQAVLDLTALPLPGELKQPVEHEDRSITFVHTHSRQREVEVLQDQLLSLFDEDPTLTPQDVIVMTPDIEVYSPHIDAVFGRVEDRDERYLPYTIADRADPTGLGIFQGIETLLRLPLSRVTASDLLGLLSIPAFRLRFGIDPDELSTLQKWLEGSGIRWGLNANHRESLGLPDGIEQNTWRFGLNRMLLGYAVGEGGAWSGIEPFDEIGGLDAALVGPLSTIVSKLEGYRNRLCRPTSPEGWIRRLSALANDFFLPFESSESLVLNHLADALDQWHKACNEAAVNEELPLQVVHEAIFSQLKESGISQRFLAGRINFCTMMPMRAIPFQIVCLLGMNDGEYPRSAQPLDFDLMAMPGHYRPGDRSRREDDRYLFLEALLSARNQLFISFIGRSIQDNSERKPSVLVSQLIDYIQAGWRTAPTNPSHPAPDGELIDQLTVNHPLQPFSPTYFQPEKWPRRFTYAHEWQHLFEPPEKPLEESTLPPVKPKTTVPFYPLIQFLKNPIRAFFNQRLQITFRPLETAIDNQEPFALDSLSPFGPGMQLLSAGLAVDRSRSQEAIAAAADRMRNTGELPLFGFGKLSIEALVKPIEKMIGYHEHLLQSWTAETTAVEIRFPVEAENAACKIVEDWLDDIRLRTSPDSKETGSSAYARWDHYPGSIRDKKGRISRYYPLVGSWFKHLFACSQKMDLTTYLVTPDGIAKIPPIEPSTAIERVNEILFYWSQGLHRLLPVTARTALAYESTLISDSSIEAKPKAIKAAKKVYEGNGYNNPGELGYADGIYLRRVFPSFDTIWEADDGQFQFLADRIYAPMIHSVSD